MLNNYFQVMSVILVLFSLLIAGVECQSSAAAAAGPSFASDSPSLVHGHEPDDLLCPLLTKGSTTTITLDLEEGGSNCFVVPSKSDGYRIEITHPGQYGRFSIFQQSTSEAIEQHGVQVEGTGYAWNAPADGIFYCTPAGSRITFDEHPPEATVNVRILEGISLEEGDIFLRYCRSDFRSYCGDAVIDGTTAKGVWYSSYDYYLRLEGLEVDLVGAEETITLEDLWNGPRFQSAQSVYDESDQSLLGQTIMFTWENESGSMDSLKLFLNIDEVTGTWFIVAVDFLRDGIEKGFPLKKWAVILAETCYHTDDLMISDNGGNKIRLLNFTLAPFLPWKKINGFDQVGVAIGVESSEEGEEVADYPNVIGNEIIWMTNRYFLHADHFEYQVKREFPVTMSGATEAEISGDPGNAEYQSIEAMWSTNGKHRRLFIYISAEQGHWKVFEARVYDQTEEWRYFYPEDFEGALGECFTRDEMVISNAEGDVVRFSNLTLATFLPWPACNTESHREVPNECACWVLSSQDGIGGGFNDDDAPREDENLEMDSNLPAVSCRSTNCAEELETSHEAAEAEEKETLEISKESAASNTEIQAVFTLAFVNILFLDGIFFYM